LIINDSTTEYLFYPKFRFQHTISYNTYSHQFKDELSNQEEAQKDSAYFNQNYNLTLRPNYSGLNFWRIDEWKSVSNDLVIRQFPQTKNPGQFIQAGVRIDNFSGEFTSSPNPIYPVQIFPPPPIRENFYNIVLHGEYRNKTRNRKWDALLNGEFYTAGYNAADFNLKAVLNRLLNARLGDIEVSFQ